MALYPSDLGNNDKTLLWSYDLSTVTSSTVFNAQTITLNDSVANYNLIEVVVAYDIRGLPNTFLGSYPDADTDCDGNLNVHIPKYIIGKTRFAVNTTLKLSSNKSTAGYRYRNITRKSDTTVEFGSGYQTGTKYEFVMVPIRIYGIK